MRVNERMKKVFSILLCLCMVLQYVPTTAFAVDAAEGGLCEHHAEHTAECGYAEAVEGQPCTHVHDELCGYIEAVAEVKCACEATDENGALVHTEGCGYVAPVEGSNCTHVHDDACGYAEAVEAHECHYECAECAAVAASEEAPEESSDPAPVCTCAEACTTENFNEYCAVCGVDYSKCTGTDTAAVYAEGTIDLSQYSEGDTINISEDCKIIGDGNEYKVSLNIAENATVTFDVGASGVKLGGQITVADGKTLTLLVPGNAEHTVNGGISLGNGSNVIIEGDLTKANNKLTVTATGSNAGIGANNGVTAGDITIRNARVDATGSGSSSAPKIAGAGIGTAKASMGNILIVNSIVTAAGGYYSEYEAHGAAIGMGSDGATMGNITLIDSEITASHSGEGHASIIGAGPDFAEGDRDGSDIGTMGDIIITNTDLHLSMAESTTDEYAAMIGTADFSGGGLSYSVNMGKIIFTDITQAELDEMIATWYIPSDFAEYGGYVLGLGYWTHVYKYNEYEKHCVGTFGGVWVSDGNGGIVQIGNDDGYYVDCKDGSFVHDFDEICGGTCSDCGVTYLVVHTMGTAATCSAKAVCSVCGDSYGEVDADAHNYGDWVSNGNGTHTRTCANDSTHTENGDCSGGTATCKEQAVCDICKTAYGVLGGHTAEPTYAPNAEDSTKHDVTYSCCGATVTEAHTLDVTTGKCGACGADMTAIATVTDGTNTYYAADAATLNQAVTAILETGSRTFTVELPADAESGMIIAIRRAICDTEGVADGSIHLTLKGVTTIPGTTNWDGVAFGPGDIYDEAGKIVDQELVTQLASINLPDVTEIGAQAFYFCENLVSVSAPKAQTIGAQAFGYTALTSVEFPELTTIPTDMFSGTWTLSSAKFPKVTTIEQGGLLVGAKFTPENNPTPFPLELTAEGNITFNGSNHFNIASQNYSGKVDLVLCCDKKDAVTFNEDGTATWQVREDLSYTFKSITFKHSYVNGKCTACGEDCTHTGGTATCTTLAVCDTCGVSYGAVDTTNHDSSVECENGFCPNGCYEPAILNAAGYYEIDNAGKLFWFAQQVNVKGNREIKGVLTANIDLENKPWTPIGVTGEENNNFRGVFDGQNYTIKGLYVEGSENGVGFFGEVRTGTVKNFRIYGNVVVNTEVNYVGGVIGSICGVNGETDLERNGAVIQNITSFVNVTAKAHGIGMIGGFVGYANHQSLIEKCAWYGTFDAGEYRVDSGAGGFIGKIQENTSEVTIRNCGAYGTIKTNYAGDYNNTATIYMGGFLSFSNTNAQTTLENCLFAGRFERGENLTDQAFLGAFGTLRSVNAIKNCYYLGDGVLEAVHSNSDLKPGSDNVEITSVTGEELRNNTIATQLGDHWMQDVHYPIPKDTKAHSDSATYTYTDNGDGTHKKTCNECGYEETSRPHTIENHACTDCGAMEIVVSFNAGDYKWETGDQINFAREVEGICIDYCVFTATVAEDGTVTWSADKPFCWYGEGEQKLFAAPNNGWSIDYFVVPEDQSTVAKLDKADLINGMWVGTPTTDTITFNMTHRMAKVTVNYEFAEGVTADISELKVYSIAQICRFSLDDWSIITSAGQYDVWVTPYLDGNQFTAFVSPDAYAADGNFIKITLDDGTVYEVKMNKAVTFAEGAEYTYKVVITADGAYLTCADECTFEYTDNGDGTHDKVCTECGYVEVDDEVHSGGTATCTELAECQHCGASYGKVDKTNHDETVAYVNGFCPNCDAYEPAVLNGEVYEISNAGQLYWFAQQVNGGNTAIDGKLTTNIVDNTGDVAGCNGTKAEGWRDWTPIGTSNDRYTGTFDGGSFTVSGLYFNNSGTSDVGLFGYIGGDGAVHDLGVVNSYISGGSDVGGVVGYALATVSVTNCYNSATVIGVNYVGGVVGYSAGPIANCHNSGTVCGTGGIGAAGGVVGRCYRTVTNCHNTGSVTGTGSLGGVVGANSGTVTNCYNTGNVSGSGNGVGGVAGTNTGTVTNCYNTGNVTGSKYTVGGVVGQNGNAGTVTNCYNTGSVTGSKYYVGGVVGQNGNAGTVTNCYYLTGCAKDGNDAVQFGIGSGTQGNTTADADGGTTGKSDFSTGEVCYLLNGDQTSVVFKQTCGTGIPVFTGETVYYGYRSCGDTEAVYTNNANVFPEKPEHTQNPTYTDNHDGTHSAVYPCCGTKGQPENHTLTYTAKDNVITAVCSANCGYSETATISAEDTTYNGTAQETATVAYSGWTGGELTVTYENNVNAGTATASITVGEVTASVKFTIEKATVTVTADAKSKPYGTENPELTYTVSGLFGSDTLTGALATTATKTSNVGEYDITVGSLGSSNYTIHFVGAKLTITKAAAPEIQWPTAAALTYGQKLSDSALTSEDKNGTFAWQDGSIVPTVKNNGYVVVYTPKDTDNYDYTVVELTETIPVTVSKGQATVTAAPTPNTLTYTGEGQYLISAGEANGGTMQYSTDNQTWSTTISQGTDAGKYTVYYKIVGDENHSDTAVDSIEVTIAKADPVIGTVGCKMPLFDSIAASAVNLTRTDMSVDGTLILTDSELTAGEGTYNWKFTPEDTDNYNTITGTVKLTVTADVLETITASGNLGKSSYVYGDTFSIDGLTITATYTSDATKDVTGLVEYSKTLSVGQTSVELTYQGKTCTVTGITVARKQLVISGMSWTVPTNAVYSGTVYTATLNGTLPEGVSMTKTGDKATNAGDYTAKAVFSLAEGYSAENYEIVNGEDLTADWTIAKKNIAGAQITLGTALTYNGKQQTQTVTKVEIDGLTVTYTVSGNTGTDAKGYTLTVTGTGNFEGTETKEWSIKKAAAVVTKSPAAKSLTYTGEAQALVNAGTTADGKLVYSLTENGEFTESIPTGKNAGEYTVWYYVVGDDNHSDSAKTSVKVTIAKAKATIKVDTTTINITYGETVNLPAATTNFGTVVCDKTAADLKNVGSYTVTYTVAGTENFEGATKTLTVKVEQLAVAEPTVTGTYTYSGREQTAQLIGVESYMTVASGNKGTNAGNYEVEVTLDGNHKWADGSDGRLQWTIAKAKAEISVNTDPITVTYGETVTLPTATTNFGDVVCNKKASDIVNAGTYTVTYTVAGTDNYDGDTKSITVIVNAKAITVTADALSKTYGDADPKLTYTAQGLVNGDELTGELKRVAGENVGSYAIEQNTLTAGNNYSITYTGANLTINAKAITEADVELNGSLTYTGKEQTQPITVTEGITYEVSGNKATNVGTYELTVKGTGNYTGSVTLGWTIAKAKLTITADSKVIYIGEKVPTLTYTASGLVGGDKLTKEPVLTTNADADQAGSYTITAANADAGDNYTITYVSGSLTIMDKETEVETKIEQTELTEVPEGLKDTQFDTVEEIKEELISKILATSTGYSAENMVHYDVALHFSLDGGDSWILATEESFPTEGITVILPYPEGTNARDYEFVVSHMFTVTSQRLGTVAGEVEMPKVEETANGICVTLNGLSPVTVAARYHDHTGGIATCTDKAICSICGTAYGELDATNHAGGTEVKNAKEATCGAEGYTGDTHCKGCGEIVEKGAAIKATGEHTYGDWKVVKEPTKTTKGEKQRTCSVCGHVDSKEIPVLSDTPATGDDSNIMLYSSMFTVSLAGLVVLLLAAKKRKQENA